MTTIENKLAKIQQEIYHYESGIAKDSGSPKAYEIGYSAKLSFFKVGDLYDISFFGDGYDDDPTTKATDFTYDTNVPFCLFLEFLCEPENAAQIISLEFTGPDQGANGSKSWRFSRLINSGVIFPMLKSFKVQLTDLADHNNSIIDGGFLEENGVVAKLISKMPQLETLVIPSAPDESFFKIGNHSLKNLTIQVGYQNQNFIDNLAKSENFNQLKYLDFTDILDYYTVDAEYFTNAESFLRLFNSKAFSTVTVFKLRNSALELDKIYELQRTKEDLLFNWVNCYGGAYVRNIMQ